MKKVSLILFVSLVLLTTICNAKKEPVRIANQILPEKDKTILVGHKFVSTKTGIPTSLSSIGFKAQSTTPEAIAREYLAANKTTLHLKNEHIQNIELTNIRQGLATTTVRFKQYYQGMEVYNSDIAISYNKNNTVNFVTNQLKPVQDVKQSKSLITTLNAQDIALSYLGDSFNSTNIKSKDVIYLNNKTYVQAYKIEISSGAIQGDWLFIIDAETGKIYIAKDTVAYQNASATVFDPDPLSTSGSGYTGNYRDNNDTTNTDLNNELFLKDIDLNTSGGTFFLKSPWAESVDNSAPNDGVFSQGSSSFDYNRQDAAFESSNTFYHLDTFLRYLNSTLGLNVKPYQYSGGVKFDAHALSGADNSNYTTGNGTLKFGEGCVDDAEDADVVIHELGHGIHDWVTNGGLSQVDGLSEGTGDYFAQSYSRSRSNQVWISSQPAYHYVFSWDGHNECWGGRTTNYGPIYPAGLSGSIHTSGQIWATCLMKVWDQIGAANTDTIVVEGLAMTGSNTNQPQAAQAVLQAAADIGMTQHLSTIQTTLNSCGYNVSVEIPSLVPSISMSGASSINNEQVFSVNVDGGVPPYQYTWDINNDNETDGKSDSITVDYQKAYSESVSVRVTDSEGLSENAMLSVNIQAPSIELQDTGSMTQMCGNNDAFVDPGERWRVPVTLQNNGFVTANNAYAVFVKGTSGNSNGNITAQDSFGNTLGSCDRQFIDISGTGTELTLVDPNPNDNLPAQDDGATVVNLSQSFNLYGQTISSLSLSTNGYISTNTAESGADFDNDCPLPRVPNNGSTTAARIIPLHDDLISQHIYHQHFSSCPRQSDLGSNLACDVFMYDDVDLWGTSGTVEHFSFEAILYPSVNQWVYQYNGSGFAPNSSTVGIQNDNATDGASYSCNTNNGINTSQAVCVYHAKNQLGSGGDTSGFHLETPAIAIGTIPVSGQHNSMVDFSVAESAQCGSSLNVKMQAAVYGAGFNQESSLVFDTTLGNNGSCNVVNNCSPNNTNDINPTNGLWFNETRPGNGNDMYYLNNGLIFIQYTALPNRSPIWYITGDGTMQNNQADYELTRLTYDGPFQSSDVTIDVIGQTLTTLIDSNNAIQTRTINGQFSAELIKTFAFGGTPDEQRTGLWYNGPEAGWGKTIGTQGSTQVNISYLYDNAGQPYWLIGSGANNDAENLNMDYFDVFCPHCPKVPNIQTNAGTLRINYDSSNETATLESMQININNENHNSQWNRSNLPLSLLTPPIDD